MSGSGSSLSWEVGYGSGLSWDVGSGSGQYQTGPETLGSIIRPWDMLSLDSAVSHNANIDKKSVEICEIKNSFNLILECKILAIMHAKFNLEILLDSQ